MTQRQNIPGVVPDCEICPTCGGRLQADPVEVQAEAIRHWCHATAVPILLGDCLRRSDAATYLGRSEKTLANWAASEDPIQTTRLNGRPYYPIHSLAEYIVKNSR